MIKFNLVQFLLVVAMVGGSAPALAHGAKIQSQTVEAISLQAHYDSGEPMAKAQVLVYAPDNPQEPWLTGTTDDKGKFLFTPEGNRPGHWQVVVRQAGHGAKVTVPVEATTISDGLVEKANEENTKNTSAMGNQTAMAMGNVNPVELSPTSQWISMGAVIWGFVGTALFFSKTKGQA